jgi:chemotaxis protein methyltransferase CheR
MPGPLRERAFVDRDGQFCVRPECRAGIEFARQDVRFEQPAGPFDLIFCRNVAFTYFARPSQVSVLGHLVARLRPGACLVIGRCERLPIAHPDLERWAPDLPIYRRV